MSDRARVVTTTIMGIVAAGLRAWLRGDRGISHLPTVRQEIETLLREEFCDVRREAANDRQPGEPV